MPDAHCPEAPTEYRRSGRAEISGAWPIARRFPPAPRWGREADRTRPPPRRSDDERPGSARDRRCVGSGQAHWYRWPSLPEPLRHAFGHRLSDGFPQVPVGHPRAVGRHAEAGADPHLPDPHAQPAIELAEKHQFIAGLDAERIPHIGRDGDLVLRRHFRHTHGVCLSKSHSVRQYH
ncbi:hypothetical protein KL86PLE_60453 [uncultured Pleomorphomonas sp.]|uniref:Uncharacterized protein n=1 Tax=uncultured Pleomorphomonas sp. TaxID=442121 RepID=A0A212LKS2_9HYPH|nr:hypothetical protein KL86PLE_60453 [uncultured Pleomorphomonas sp.]